MPTDWCSNSLPMPTPPPVVPQRPFRRPKSPRRKRAFRDERFYDRTTPASASAEWRVLFGACGVRVCVTQHLGEVLAADDAGRVVRKPPRIDGGQVREDTGFQYVFWI